MIYGSVCSGIEAATVAWHPLGWMPAWFAEIEAFPSAVLAHHYPAVPNLDDFTKIGVEHGSIELLVGGTPCQSFSVAGKRLGLDDPRGNLAIEFLRLAKRLRPRWILWENVPGVLSSDGGRDFYAFLNLLGQCGYGWSYRVLDAQFFGVPQRRRRVFVAGHLGDWRPAAAVLFERASLQRHTASSRETGQGTSYGFGDGISSGIAKPLGAHALSKGRGSDLDNTTYVASVANPLGAHSPRYDLDNETYVPSITHFPDIVAFDLAQITSATNRTRAEAGLPAGTMNTSAQMHVAIPGIAHTQSPQSFAENQRGELRMSDISLQLTTGGGKAGQGYPSALQRGQVRRLTPRECERLQGLPDDYTLVPYRGKPAVDGPRYRAIGNSMAVPVIRWIGRRIEAVDALQEAA